VVPPALPLPSSDEVAALVARGCVSGFAPTLRADAWRAILRIPDAPPPAVPSTSAATATATATAAAVRNLQPLAVPVGRRHHATTTHHNGGSGGGETIAMAVPVTAAAAAATVHAGWQEREVASLLAEGVPYGTWRRARPDDDDGLDALDGVVDRQIVVDVRRGFHFEGCGDWTHEERVVRVRQLAGVLHAVFPPGSSRAAAARARGAPATTLWYCQGMHDIAAVLLLTLGPRTAPAALRALTADHLARVADPTLAYSQAACTFVVHLLAAASAPLAQHLEAANVPPVYMLSWLLTWFSHAVPALPAVATLFDVFLCSHPLFPSYVAAALVLHYEAQLRALPATDIAPLFPTLQSLPRHITAAASTTAAVAAGAAGALAPLPVRQLVAAATVLFEAVPPANVLPSLPPHDAAALGDEVTAAAKRPLARRVGVTITPALAAGAIHLAPHRSGADAAVAVPDSGLAAPPPVGPPPRQAPPLHVRAHVDGGRGQALPWVVLGTVAVVAVLVAVLLDADGSGGSSSWQAWQAGSGESAREAAGAVNRGAVALFSHLTVGLRRLVQRS